MSTTSTVNVENEFFDNAIDLLTCYANIFEVRSLGQSSEGKYPNFWRYSNFFYNSLGYVEGSLHTKTSSIRPAVSIQYQLVTDGRTDGWTDGHMMTAYTTLAYRRTVKTTYSETTLSVDYKPALNLGHAL